MRQETISYINYFTVDGIPCVKVVGTHPQAGKDALVPLNLNSLSPRGRKVVQSAIDSLNRRDGVSI